MLQISKEDKYKKLFNILSRWVALNEKNIHVDQYFKDKKINKIAIQGFGRLGRHLLFELKKYPESIANYWRQFFEAS